jgi:hypothetical protein
MSDRGSGIDIAKMRSGCSRGAEGGDREIGWANRGEGGGPTARAGTGACPYLVWCLEVATGKRSGTDGLPLAGQVPGGRDVCHNQARRRVVYAGLRAFRLLSVASGHLRNCSHTTRRRIVRSRQAMGGRFFFARIDRSC